MARLVKMTKIERVLAKSGYKLVNETPITQRRTPSAKKPMSLAARKAISKGQKASWAAKKSGKSNGNGHRASN